MTVATIPVGYADGMKRDLSGKGRVFDSWTVCTDFREESVWTSLWWMCLILKKPLSGIR